MDSVAPETEVASVHVRYKLPGSAENVLAVWPLFASDVSNGVAEADAETTELVALVQRTRSLWGRANVAR